MHQKKKKKRQQTKLKVIKSFTSYGDTIRNKLICSNMDGPSDGHAKWSKSDKDNIWHRL